MPVIYAVVGWLIFTIVMVVLEAVTYELVAIWLALGGLGAMVASACGSPFWVQLLVFSVISAATLILTRPFVSKFLRGKKVPTNADSYIGNVGRVEKEINSLTADGRVVVKGVSWWAVSEDGDAIPEGETVVVKSIEGAKLIVEKVI